MTNKNEQAPKVSENGPDMAGHQTATSGKNLKSQLALTEEKVLSFWQESKIFEKTLSKDSSKGEYVFYDGPPFATGLPHYGHILAGIIKDAVPRYQTMRGRHVKRRWGWDCHGLPIENLIQKENNLKTKQDIENFGIKKFNEAAKASVFKYREEWEKIIPRTGRFIDMENSYTTMDSSFSESVMWAFKKLYDEGHVYEGFKTMHISPALETPLSNFEVNQNYLDITDISVFAKFKIEEDGEGKKKGETGTYLIAWTTTPWTLPGNAALAVGKDIEYVKVEHNFGKDEKNNKPGRLEKYIVAKERLDTVFKDKKYKIVSEFSGKDLVGKKYVPLFDYYKNDKNLENRENGWQVYEADFVTTDEGTGIVHIAPAFGEDDLNLGKNNNLPFIQHVKMDGRIKDEAKDFAGQEAKPMATKEEPNKHQKTDIEIIKYLAHHDGLFDKEKIIHAYPHCWRTDAPLLNYAMSSWFVKVADQREKMIKLNKKVNWVPKMVGEKRFGNWLENVKDWGISRSRFWGTPIPIWRNEDDDVCVMGSLDDIRDKTRGTNNFYLMRHGEADHNVKKFLSSDNSEKGLSHLTEKGRRDIEQNAEKLKEAGIDMVFVSPLLRTQQTAQIITDLLGIKKENIITDERITEVQSGVLNGQPESAFHKQFSANEDRFIVKPENGENLSDIRKRVGDFIYDIDQKYNNKKILVVTHDYPIWLLKSLNLGLDNKETMLQKETLRVQPGSYLKYDFAPIPHNDDYVLDYHRPYIDEITFQKDGKTYKRIEDVFDTWFDSGSMPFAINHYPFNVDNFDPEGGIFKKGKGFPANFIAEGLDQTRGWFYTLLALNTLLFKKAPYKNVVVNGLVLAEDGKKMSKRLQNYPDPSLIFDQYGADAARYYMLSSPIVRSEPLNFTEKGVDEVVKKISNRLLNVVSFFEMYASQECAESEVRPDSDNPLDEWILNRLSETCEAVTEGMNNYELDRASRPILELVDDLSTWYLRRSRDRFKKGSDSDKNIATKTIAYVLMNISKILAPFMPFLAEEIYQRITKADFKDQNKSVHLTSWPELQKSSADVTKKMDEVRELVSIALEARDKALIKVRQPLQKIFVSSKTLELGEPLLDIIKDEVNIKEVLEKYELGEKAVELDTHISEVLKIEGISRELIRLIQSARKKAGLKPDDKINLQVATDEKGVALVKQYESDLKIISNVHKINFVESRDELGEISEKVSVEDYEFTISF